MRPAKSTQPDPSGEYAASRRAVPLSGRTPAVAIPPPLTVVSTAMVRYVGCRLNVARIRTSAGVHPPPEEGTPSENRRAPLMVSRTLTTLAPDHLEPGGMT